VERVEQPERAGVSAISLPPADQHQPDQHHDNRITRDRLELLTTLINGPSVDPLFRTDVIQIPPQHLVYGWECVVGGCERPRAHRIELCFTHGRQWYDVRNSGTGITRAAFVRAAQPLGPPSQRGVEVSCRICPDRPAEAVDLRLCHHHKNRWYSRQQTSGPVADIDAWAADETPRAGFGLCQVVVCPDRAGSPLGLCLRHRNRYRSMGCPGDASLPAWWRGQDLHDRPIRVRFEDEAAFRRWCATVGPSMRLGQLILLGLRPLLATEIKWGLVAHTQQRQRAWWPPDRIQNMVNFCRQRGLGSLTELELDDCIHHTRLMVREMRNALRLVYYTPAEARAAGFIEAEHFGVQFPHRLGHLDLTGVSQRWLRELLWDHLADALRSPKRPRSQGPLDQLRRACLELSAFLEVDAPGGGHDPTLLREEHMRRFVADQQHREHHSLPALAVKRADGKPSTVTEVARRLAFSSIRRLLRSALESGEDQRLGLDRAFITAMPAAGIQRRARSPFSDEVARAVADEANLRQLADTYDPLDLGLRDIWETIILTGRRCGEVLKLRLGCLGRYGGLAMLWHDQTKVGHYDQAIRIPERLYQRLVERQRKTLARFELRHGRPPAMQERARMALFPSRIRNPNGEVGVSYAWFHRGFRPWIEELDLGHVVPHQARHTLATNLLRHGATLSHIRRYLGQVSDRMAEHYVHLSHSDLEDVLNHVWVAGPGAPNPGELLTDPTISGTPMTRERALALAVDLSRRSTPAEGGFCTFQPVVDGGACPWNLDCHNCDKFVLSGADLLYWRRKREQWASVAERAPDDATADYLHQVFEPTARAIDGLEKALAGLGLLEEALALDLRRPQDYFHRLWSLTFPAAKLAATDSADDGEPNGAEIDLGEPQDASA
jgi:integrase